MQKLKTFILSAGYGKRLQPFTSITPKPLLPCMGVPPLLLNLQQLHEHGVQEIALNTHHLADQIKIALPTELGVKIFHEPTLLGTVGFAQNILAWAGDMPLLVYNADIVSEINFAALQATHFAADAYATLMLLPNPAPNQTHLYTDDQQITGISAAQFPSPTTTQFPSPSAAQRLSSSATPSIKQTFGFACAQIWSPAFLQDIVRYQHRDLFTALQQALSQAKHLSYHVHDGLWHDLGTPAAIMRAHYELQKRLKATPEYLGITKLLPAPLTLTATDIRIGSPAIDPHCSLKPPNYLLHPNISIAAGAALHNCLVWGKTRVTGRHTHSLIMHDMVVKI